MKPDRPLTHYESHLAVQSDIAPSSDKIGDPRRSLLGPALRAAQIVKPGRDPISRAQMMDCVFRSMSDMIRLFGSPQAQTTWNEQFALVNTHRAGSHVYRIAGELTHLLRDCSFKVEKRSVRPPHAAVYLVWEDNGMTIEGPDGAVYPLEGAYVLHMHESDNSEEPGWQLYLVFVTKEETLGKGNILWLRRAWNPDSTEIVDSKTIAADTLQRFAEKGRKAGTDLEQAFNLVVNTLLYLTLPSAELRFVQPEIAKRGLHAKNPKKAEKAARSINRQVAYRCYTLVGENVRYVRRGAESAGTGEHTNRRLTSRQLVSGHFKTVHFGEKNEQHRIHFIAPYHRGPKDAAEAAAVHIAKVLSPKKEE